MNPNYNQGYGQPGYVQPGYGTHGQYGQTLPGQVPTVQGHVVQTGTVPVGVVTANKWSNPFNRNIPSVSFNAQCKKCHGTGVRMSTFTKTPLPCDRCYTRAGYCKKCYGTGMHYRKNKACTKCQQGKRLQARSSSSSSSDRNPRKY